MPKSCKKCGHTKLTKNGTNRAGSQRYKCHSCGSSLVYSPKTRGVKVDKEAVYRSFKERNSYRSIGRIFNISHTTVARWLKERTKKLKALKETILPKKAGDVIEVDEIFTYIGKKSNQIRIWIAQNKRTKQILTFFVGDGSMNSAKRMWRKLPYDYQRATSYSDFLASYNAIPKETHTKVGKETGLTNHIERLNNTIRQRIGRMVRKTLSFSKKEYMLNIHFKLWAYEYNLEKNNP